MTVINSFPGLYDRERLIDHITCARGTFIPNRIDVNALASLLELFRYSPLGPRMGVGRVERQGNRTILEKPKQLPAPPLLAVLHVLTQLVKESGKPKLVLGDLGEVHPRSPCRLFSNSARVFAQNCLNLACLYPWLATISDNGQLTLATFDETVAVINRYA